MAMILLIEDDDMLRGYLKEALDDAGCDVTAARNGIRGLALFATHLPDLVITDLIMDDGEGIGSIMEIRRSHPELPIIAISGNPLYLENSRKLGADRTLLKPFSKSELLKNIDVLLASEVRRSA